MKLKKIASLALAGVMAVSMLAGCATNKPEEKPDEGPVTTTSLSTEVGALVEDVPEYVTFADSDKLDSALKAAVEYAGVKDVLPEYIHLNQLTEVYGRWSTVASKLDEKLADKAYTPNTLNKYGYGFNWIGTVTNGMDGEKGMASQLYVVSKNVGDTALKEMIAEKLEKADIAKYMKCDLMGDNWNYDYTVSVSTCTKTVNSSAAAENPTVTFVAVQVVRTATHQ